MSLHSITDRFIEDIVKAARESFAQSPRRRPGEELHIQVSGSGGHKLANHAALGAGLGGLLLPGLGAPIGAAIGADEGQGLSAAGGTLIGGLGGGLAGRLVGNALGGAQGRLIGSGLGAAAGALYGANRGGERTASALDEACVAGMKTAAARYGIKEAFIGPLLGSIAGPALARAGVGALARGAGGGALGSMARRVLPRIGGGIGGMAFDAATSMAGGALGNKLQPQGPMG